ncbi:MAG: YcaQ family DNA glycosylase [Micromonosporaceae bacterium]|nr:YcaQ family DNA glycosylase [Micromonosporaceae bacterium]
MLELSREQARRIAVRAQLLDADRPDSLVAVVDHLTQLQVDPTAAIAPSADLVAWSRLGADYSPSDLVAAIERERSLVEYGGFVRPMADIGLYLATVQAWPRAERARAWMDANDRFRRDVLARLEGEGPLPATAIPDSAQVPWESSGWTNDRNVTQLLEFLWMYGEVAVSGRDGRHRLWDLAERVYPADLVVPPAEQAAGELAARRLAALGIARARPEPTLLEPSPVGEIAVEATVEGVPGTWRVDRDALRALEGHAQPGVRDEFAGRTALLSPFDRLVFDRTRAQELFGFEYVLEMYKPAAKRRWGYFALPILHGDRLIGKLDAKADRKAGVLRVHAVHEDLPFSPEATEAVDAEIDALAEWLGLIRG